MRRKRSSEIEILREYAVRAAHRAMVCLVLAAAVILWDALPLPACC